MNAVVENYLMPGGGASITALPKVSLHDHLDGGLRPQTIIELADADGMDVPATDAVALGTWSRGAVRLGLVGRVSEDVRHHYRCHADARGLARVAASSCRTWVRMASSTARSAGPRAAPHTGTDALTRRSRRCGGLDAGVEDVRHAGGSIRWDSSSARCVTPTAVSRSRSWPCVTARAASSGSISRAPRQGSRRQPPRRIRLPGTPLPAHHRARGEADGLDSIRGALFDGRARGSVTVCASPRT